MHRNKDNKVKEDVAILNTLDFKNMFEDTINFT